MDFGVFCVVEHAWFDIEGEVDNFFTGDVQVVGYICCGEFLLVLVVFVDVVEDVGVLVLGIWFSVVLV